MIEAGQANAAQNQAGMYPCVGWSGGQGIPSGGANAASMGTHVTGRQGRPGAPALTGIIEGAKNSIAAINTVLTTLRTFIGRPQRLQASKLSFAH
jgi:hypothetical protein